MFFRQARQCLLTLLPCLCFWACHLHAQETAPAALVPTLAYCLDTDGSMTIERVGACDFQAHHSSPDNTRHAAHWIRITADLPTAQPMGLRLYVGPHFLSQIDFFEQTQERWQPQHAGNDDALTPAPAHAVIGGYRFVTGPRPAGVNVFYLRIDSSGPVHARIDLEPMSAPDAGLFRQQIGLGMQMGGLALMWTMGLIAWVVLREPMMARFAVYVADLMLCLLSGSGLLFFALWPESPQVDRLFFHAAICTRLACWVWLLRGFFIGLKPPGWYVWMCRVLYVLVLGCLLLVTQERHALAFGLILLGSLFFTAMHTLALWRTPGMQVLERNVLSGGMAASAGLLLLLGLVAIYPNDSQTVTYVARLLDLATPLLLLLLIAFKSRQDRQELGRVKTVLAQENLRAQLQQQSLDERKTLIDMLVHELKNPLASIGFSIRSIESVIDPWDEQPIRRLQNIRHSIRNMDQVIERCSLMNLMDQRNATLRFASCVLSDFLQALVSEHPAHARVTLHVEPEIVLQTDAQLLRIAVSNLLENAVKYSRADSRIQVVAGRSSQGAAGVQIRIENMVGAHGVPDVHEVFRKFYRHPLAQSLSGSGLGLYLVREICHWLGGDVHYRCTDGQHVVFDMALPA